MPASTKSASLRTLTVEELGRVALYSDISIPMITFETDWTHRYCEKIVVLRSFVVAEFLDYEVRGRIYRLSLGNIHSVYCGAQTNNEVLYDFQESLTLLVSRIYNNEVGLTTENTNLRPLGDWYRGLPAWQQVYRHISKDYSVKGHDRPRALAIERMKFKISEHYDSRIKNQVE